MNEFPPRADEKAPTNRTHSKRFARFQNLRPSRSVWTACVFSAAFLEKRHGAIRCQVKRSVLALVVVRCLIRLEASHWLASRFRLFSARARWFTGGGENTRLPLPPQGRPAGLPFRGERPVAAAAVRRNHRQCPAFDRRHPR